VKIGPDVRPAFAARLADKAWLKVGEADVIRPLIGADCDRMTATIVRTIDQETADA
jgi:hypothetical protein